VTFAPSVSERTISSRKRGSRIGTRIDPFQRRVIWFESGLEAAWLQVLIADPRVHAIHEQQKLEIPFGDRMRIHTIDFLVFWKSGRVSACAVKYVKDVTDDLRALLETAAASVGDRFADDYRLLTEKGIDRTKLWNARQIIGCARDFDFEAQEELARRLGKAPDHVRVGDCDAMLGDGLRGSRAAMALIKTGRLVVPAGVRLDRHTVLRNLFTS
jgi:hypothetical protein